MLKSDANSLPMPLWTSVGYRRVAGLISAYSLMSLTKSLSLPIKAKLYDFYETLQLFQGRVCPSNSIKMKKKLQRSSRLDSSLSKWAERLAY